MKPAKSRKIFFKELKIRVVKIMNNLLADLGHCALIRRAHGLLRLVPCIPQSAAVNSGAIAGALRLAPLTFHLLFLSYEL
jgi:hypothetical protein